MALALPPRGWIDVWEIDLDESLPGASRMLDQVELARARRLVCRRVRERYLVAHAATRQILGRYLGLVPAELEIKCDRCDRCGAAHGKPGLANGGGLDFNLAHSEGMGLLAVGGRRVGIDLEWIGRPVDDRQLAPRIMRRVELEAFKRTRPDRRQIAFLATWTRKESVVKAAGVGLATLPSSVWISRDGLRARLLGGCSGESSYALAPLELSRRSFVATLATPPPAPNIRLFQWRPDPSLLGKDDARPPHVAVSATAS